MASWRLSIASSLPPFVLLLATAAPPACYKPNISDGGLRCNLDGGAKACPEGFTCNTSTQICVTHLDGGGDKTDLGDGDTEAGPICFEARPACTPTSGGGMCDPYCQTGCGCREKCSVNTAGAPTCNQLAVGQQRTLLQPCEIQAGGMVSQTDQCAPGLVCREDNCGGGGGAGRCYQFCRNDMDCTDAPCNQDIGGGFKVCDVPYDDCVPLGASANTGCTGTAITCYLATTDLSKTICDCQIPPGLREGDICTRSRECNAGLVCVDPNGLGQKQCTRVCRLAVPNDCLGTCRMLTEGGATNTTYGFCR